jgi:hypothetical protein
MGRSLFPVAVAPAPPTGEAQNNPFQAFGTQFRVEHQPGWARHVQTRLGPDGRPAAEMEWEVHYVIGSGQRGHSFVTDWDGYVFQAPVSWYAQKKEWALSPGFDAVMVGGRAVVPECLFCHANRANHVEGTVNRYRPPVFDGHAIGCQRCHGPGELHVASRERLEPVPDKVDHTIVNPRHLPWALREAVCEQCHLTGEIRTLGRGRGVYDFRPGLPLEAFWSVFVRDSKADDPKKAVSHVEQMYQSRCFQGGDDQQRLGCISCHDPHRVVRGQERVGFYRKRCLACHEQKGCTEVAERRQARQDSCIDCHMPRYGSSDIPHTAATDHRILRGGKAAPRDGAAGPPGDTMPVLSFYRGRKGVDNQEEERDRAVALVKAALRGNPSAIRAVGYSLPGLEAALRRDPDDLVAVEAKGYALALQEQSTEALAEFEAVLAKAPDREPALVGAAWMAEALGKSDAALGYWRRAVAANPWAAEYRRSLTLLLVKKEAWADAGPHCQAWLRLDPLSAEARAARVSCLLAAGDKAGARAEFARVEALAPPNLRELRIRFEQKLK